MSSSVTSTFSGTEIQNFSRLFALNGVIIVVSTALLTLLLYTRLRKVKADLLLYHYFLMAGYFFIIVGCFLDIYRCYISQETQDLFQEIVKEQNQMTQMLILKKIMDYGVQIAKESYAAPMMYYTAMWLTKGALLAISFNLRVNMTKPLKIALYASVFYLIASYIVVIFSHAFWCPKPSRNWDLMNICSPWQDLAYVILTFVLTITTDIVVMLLMSTIILKLQISRREKLAFGFVVIVGTVSIIATVIRIVMVIRIVDNPSSARTTKGGNEITLWSQIEMLFAFVAASLPSLRVFFRKTLKSTAQSLTHSGGKGSKGSWRSGDSQSSYNRSFTGNTKRGGYHSEMGHSQQNINVQTEHTVVAIEYPTNQYRQEPSIPPVAMTTQVIPEDWSREPQYFQYQGHSRPNDAPVYPRP